MKNKKLSNKNKAVLFIIISAFCFALMNLFIRLTGDVPRKILVSPEWSYRKRTILNMINSELKNRDTRQGAAL